MSEKGQQIQNFQDWPLKPTEAGRKLKGGARILRAFELQLDEGGSPKRIGEKDIGL